MNFKVKSSPLFVVLIIITSFFSISIKTQAADVIVCFSGSQYANEVIKKFGMVEDHLLGQIISIESKVQFDHSGPSMDGSEGRFISNQGTPLGYFDVLKQFYDKKLQSVVNHLDKLKRVVSNEKIELINLPIQTDQDTRYRILIKNRCARAPISRWERYDSLVVDRRLFFHHKHESTSQGVLMLKSALKNRSSSEQVTVLYSKVIESQTVRDFIRKKGRLIRSSEINSYPYILVNNELVKIDSLVEAKKSSFPEAKSVLNRANKLLNQVKVKSTTSTTTCYDNSCSEREYRSSGTIEQAYNLEDSIIKLKRVIANKSWSDSSSSCLNTSCTNNQSTDTSYKIRASLSQRSKAKKLMKEMAKIKEQLKTHLFKSAESYYQKELKEKIDEIPLIGEDRKELIYLFFEKRILQLKSNIDFEEKLPNELIDLDYFLY